MATTYTLTGYANGAAVKAALDKAGTALQADDVGNSAARDVGTTAGTVAAGDDPRIVAAEYLTALTMGAR